MSALQIEIPGEPQPKQRPRVVRDGTRTYTPAATRTAEARIGWAMLQSYPGLQVDAVGLYHVSAHFYTDHAGKDADNLLKTCLDACNGVVWGDDRQVIVLHAEVHRRSGAPPHTRLEISPVEELK